MSQQDRVLRALRHAGAQGLTQVDFLRTPTIDGGPPITRVAARIEELREEGHRIMSGERRDRCVVYRLESWDVGRAGGAPVEANPVAGAGDTTDPPEIPTTTPAFLPVQPESPRRPSAYDPWEQDAA